MAKPKTSNLIHHQSDCQCEDCTAVREFAADRGVVLFELPYRQIPEDQRKKVYKIAKPIEGPVAPGRTTIREVKSERVRDYVRDAEKYITYLEEMIGSCPGAYISEDPCKCCGAQKWEGYICWHCKENDGTLDFG